MTLPGGSWVAALRLGYQDPGDREGSHLAAQMDLGVGLSDRVELRQLLVLTVRLGSPQTAEALLHVGSRGFGMSGSNPVLAPTLGVQGILPMGKGNRFILGVQAFTWATTAESLAFYNGKWLGSATGGWSLRIGDRLLLTAGASVGYDWGRNFSIFDRKARSRNSFVEFGSVIAHGGAPLPLISFRITDWLAIDGMASVRLDEGLPPLTQTLGGLSLWF